MSVGIVVCDDEKNVHEEIAEIIKEYEKCDELVVHNCYSIRELLSYKEDYEAILLDVNLQDGNGIETIEHLPKMGRDKKIIMLTASREDFKDAFKIGAVRYVTKPINKEELFEALDCLLLLEGATPLKVYDNNNMIKLPQEKVAFIQSKTNYRKIFTNDLEFDSRITMKELEQILDSNVFIKVHRAYIVNMNYISKLEKERLIMKNGMIVPISRRHYSDVIEAIVLFDRGMRKC